MYALKFDENVCETCPTGDCLVKCQYINIDKDTAVKEMLKISRGEDSFVFDDCVTCYACEEYCKRGNHPFYLITEKREEKGLLTSPRAITKQWINIGEMQGKYRLGDVKEKVLSFGYMPEFLKWVRGKLFEDVMPSFIFGQEFFCNVVYIHFANTSIIKERLPIIMENFRKLGVKEVICMHDECYGSFAHLAPAYGIEVPFKPIHYFEYLYGRLQELKDEIRPLNIKAAYQRPCSARLSSDKHHYVADIMELIGVELVDREYQGENALCCGGIFSMCFGYDLANDVQKRNIDDMAEHGAEYCFFNCPACQSTLGIKVAKRGIKPVHIIDLCKMAIGEK
jgi:Fe-S oxidoreductase